MNVDIHAYTTRYGYQCYRIDSDEGRVYVKTGVKDPISGLMELGRIAQMQSEIAKVLGYKKTFSWADIPRM